ncbi:hypothetical protein [Novosphingobium sp.]|uniref:hypothetical protein n=1 Tax=Novosphingobium sp. TaxID=1874826 RepID=UPI0038B96CD9
MAQAGVSQVRGGRTFRADDTHVSLAECLTLLAFGDALTSEELRAQVEGERPPNAASAEDRLRAFFAEGCDGEPASVGKGHFVDRQTGLDELAEALFRLRLAVERGTMVVRGRYTSSYSAADAHLADVTEMTGSVLATYSQFDVSTGALRRQGEGMPSVIWRDDPLGFDREVDSFSGDARAADGYFFVEVAMEGLGALLESGRITGVPGGGHSTRKGEKDCVDWLAAAFEADPQHKRTKDSFRQEALVRFHRRLSNRGFIRAWDAVAPNAGRSLPGRKS